MQLKDLREFVANLPEEFNDYELMNGEYGILVEDGEDNLYYRRDNPISVATVDEASKEIILLHQTQEKIDVIKDGNS